MPPILNGSIHPSRCLLSWLLFRTLPSVLLSELSSILLHLPVFTALGILWSRSKSSAAGSLLRPIE